MNNAIKAVKAPATLTRMELIQRVIDRAREVSRIATERKELQRTAYTLDQMAVQYDKEHVDRMIAAMEDNILDLTK